MVYTYPEQEDEENVDEVGGGEVSDSLDTGFHRKKGDKCVWRTTIACIPYA